MCKTKTKVQNQHFFICYLEMLSYPSQTIIIIEKKGVYYIFYKLFSLN